MTLCNLRRLKEIVKWYNDNYQYLNVSKTKRCVLILKKCKKAPKPVWIKGGTVDRVSAHKYLGVAFDNNLSWNDQKYTKIHRNISHLWKNQTDIS